MMWSGSYHIQKYLQLKANDIGCLVVVKDGNPVGIITERDLGCSHKGMLFSEISYAAVEGLEL
ncbi:MAG: CBS domain-containing protein [Nitrososphaerales archaeon]